MHKSVYFLLVIFFIGATTVSLVTLPPPPPPGSIGPYINSIFPTTVPGEGSSWELEDPMPGLTIASPLRIISFPNSEDVLVLNKIGEVWRVSVEDQLKELVLDIKDRSFKKGEAGATGIALHPQFGMPNAPDQQLLFVFYRSKPNPDQWSERGFNRLSKFAWDDQSQTFDKNSEEILIQQYDRFTWHNGGGMFFDLDGFLYVSFGDEGADEFQVASTQRLDGGFFSGIIRIDVDNDPSRSHPIRRQPLVNAAPPPEYDGWETFSQGYSIPNDNPWLSPDSSHLEEFHSIGLRSPYSMDFDYEDQQIWVADVGSDMKEEINKVDRGDNLQWPYMEGTLERPENERPATIIGQEKSIFFEYDRSVGNCVIGGGVYRGAAFPNLNGKYLFADYGQDKLMALSNTNSSTVPTYETLLNGLNGPGIELPESPGITGIHVQTDGQILITITGNDFTAPSKILRLRQKTFVPDPPARLSELGVFTDLESLTPIIGIIPYRVNSPLWSDRALKKRWLAIPNDGTYDTNVEQIRFDGFKDWGFPAGTVFIKHFELPSTTDPEGPVIRLETRFFILGESGIGYGLTYKWNEEGTDALLAGGGSSKDFNILDENGDFAFTQTWDYPGRDQCMSCHTSNAQFVLGVKTHQLNGDLHYPAINQTMNQLSYLKSIGVFHTSIDAPSNYPQSHPIEDENIDLGLRIRSYLDANCSSCHRLGGVPNVSMDLRFNLPLELQNIVSVPTQSEVSEADHFIVRPGDHASSELWIRDASMETNRMPPLARNLLDQIYVDKLAEWIDGLSEDAGKVEELLVYPNPSSGYLVVQMSRSWEPPFQINVYSINGQLVQQQASDTHVTYLDLNNQPAGMYAIEMLIGEDRQIQKVVLR
ncbi:MAG: PQQ-dependent sugar dehydrogenase [Bacteroidota bacterium]